MTLNRIADSTSHSAANSSSTPAVFIDGEAGTTGLQIGGRLAQLSSVSVISIDHDHRKDPAARRAMMAESDLVVLCLPDDAAKQAVALAGSLGDAAPKIVDASTAHRTSKGWVYGFPEMTPTQSGKIKKARRVANPGCYASGAIALIKPLIEAGFIAPDDPLTINAVSGYSGGGKAMIADYESGNGPAFQLYGLGLDHKHIPEIMAHSGLTRQPLLVPSVAAFAQGMLVSLPLQLDSLEQPPSLSDLDELFNAYYANAGAKVHYHYNGEEAACHANKLQVDPVKGSDTMDLWVFGNEAEHQALLVARLDNLGKGAAGAAVQNIELMLGL